MYELQTMTIKDFATFCKIGERKMREIVKIDGFPCLKLGKKRLILADKAQEWLRDNYSLIK